ncbi:hypothetical protein EDD18DRAFT_442796 [Armillaria luteobubalina]|uniref:Uncharacterized protein n=1 Tax=Armillaria luteobubalina TaxID=153913 RepID=A0AA39PYL8_9AGAR|nr:hypothetical protein EDD18DRAFT_442796 [Armillaria luteobubalina]
MRSTHHLRLRQLELQPLQLLRMQLPPSNIGVPDPGFDTFNQGQSLTQPPHLCAALPPRQATAPIPAPPKRIENGGWNGAPVVGDPRSPSASVPSKPAAITSPFPNSTPEPILEPQGGLIQPPS